jgi:twinkle protein
MTMVGCQGDQIGRRHALWLEHERGISLETAVRLGIYTGRHSPIAEAVVHDPAGDILVFPFIERGHVVNEKYRGALKKFWQRKGGHKTFWNSDVMDDPLLEQGAYPLIITEGEPDALAAMDCGFQFTVSVPDGAPAVPEGKKPDELEPLDPTHEGAKFEYVWNNRDRLKRIKRFVIAVDNDGPGTRLAAELVRRLSAARCSFVTYPPDPVLPVRDENGKPTDELRACKDLNDVLVAFGRDGVVKVLNGAKPYPVKGLYRLKDYPPALELQTFSLGWDTLDQHLKIFPGEFMVVTGIPGHGKSTLMMNALVNLSESYRWVHAVFSPEMPVMVQMRNKLRKMRLRHPPASPFECDRADDWINDHFVFIDADPYGQDNDDFNLDWILDRATDAVMRYGVHTLLLDPWNEIEHAREAGESMTDYIGRSIRTIKRWARQWQVATIVIAHPTKDVGKDGKSRPVTLYDIEGSAHWFNKPDHGLIVDRYDDTAEKVKVIVPKVRHEDTGKRGEVLMKFSPYSQRFAQLLENPDVTPQLSTA